MEDWVPILPSFHSSILPTTKRVKPFLKHAPSGGFFCCDWAVMNRAPFSIHAASTESSA